MSSHRLFTFLCLSLFFYYTISSHTPECESPGEKGPAECRESCPPEDVLGGRICSGGGVCCLIISFLYSHVTVGPLLQPLLTGQRLSNEQGRRTIEEKPFDQIDNWVTEKQPPPTMDAANDEADIDDDTPNYYWSYLRNLSHAKRSKGLKLKPKMEKWGYLGVELPVDMESLSASTTEEPSADLQDQPRAPTAAWPRIAAPAVEREPSLLAEGITSNSIPGSQDYEDMSDLAVKTLFLAIRPQAVKTTVPPVTKPTSRPSILDLITGISSKPLHLSSASTTYLHLDDQKNADDDYDCGDVKDRLRCRRTCPESRLVEDRSCPFGRVCCRSRARGVFIPLRTDPLSDPASIPPLPTYEVYNYLVNLHDADKPVRIVEDENDVYQTDDLPLPPNGNVHSNEIDNHISGEEMSISVKQCKKYQDLTVDYLHAMPLLADFMPFELPMDNCLPLFMPLVVGGQNATKGEFPHMAAIGYEKDGFRDYLCGGTLISEKFILTAAHCALTKWGPPVSVLLGTVSLYGNEGVEVGIKKIIPHPDYSPPSYYDDIALLELEEEVEFSMFLRPACLALPSSGAQETGSVTIATGWGKTGFARPSSMDLMKVPLEVIDNKKCEEFYASEIRLSSLNEGINNKLLCAKGHENEYQDTCQGDSGGPLQAFLPGHNCMLEVVAVTAFGKTCGTPIPGVYTKVEPYVPWIESIVWP